MRKLTLACCGLTCVALAACGSPEQTTQGTPTFTGTVTKVTTPSLSAEAATISEKSLATSGSIISGALASPGEEALLQERAALISASEARTRQQLRKLEAERSAANPQKEISTLTGNSIPTAAPTPKLLPALPENVTGK